MKEQLEAQARERQEKERLDIERRETKKKERLEAERLQKKEQERLEAQQREKDRVEAERRERERLNAEKAAAGGNASAMYSLGVLYQIGRGVAQDYAKARDWYQKAADAGNTDAKQALLRLLKLP